jgi:[glutamine synthetase] adenylyltransferase / [glutamine synthetase]-adenylyl-L-tyrosine phosphorylase
VKEISQLPDPERARKNIASFIDAHPDFKPNLQQHYDEIAALFSHSQFLANYCIKNPAPLFKALGNLRHTPDSNDLRAELRWLFASCSSINEGMGIVRRFRKDKQIAITLKDILETETLQGIMLEMSNVADAVLAESLVFVASFLDQRYGKPEDNALSVMALGKLGAQELNYSSDVDLMFVYREDGETTGAESIPGMMINRVSAAEYYVKLVEEFTKFISRDTEDGFAYRVDLRLRPEGQRGSLALSIRGYEDYYEAWGQLWEKAALLRARHIAGDEALGAEFISAVTPFIYRKYLDHDTIDEIKRMKGQVEQLKSGTFSRDIKRGYGGIREIEFFIQIFQLMYGGKEPILRERSTIKALHRLVQKGMVGHEDMRHLSDNYIFLRNLEHRMQQLNDLQTHSLPAGEKELEILARKMGIAGSQIFLAELGKRRDKVRSIYDSLFQGHDSSAGTNGEADEGILSSIFWDVETPIKQPIEDELSRRGVCHIDRAIHYLMQIRNSIYLFQTIRGRRLLSYILPRFVEKALDGDNPDAALLQLVGFSRLLATVESYLELIVQRPEVIDSFNFVFSHSEYLSKVLMGNPEYMASLIEAPVKRRSLKDSRTELDIMIERMGTPAAIRVFRRLEEIRLGILMLNGEIDVTDLMRGISTVAEAVLCSLVDRHSTALGIAAFGKLGGREIIFNSDLDIVFLTLNDPGVADIKDAENLLKMLMSYTKDGVAFKVDTRLRPDGNKGTLVSSIEGISEYYLKSAHPWELQALLKARPVSGDTKTVRAFIAMRRKALWKRGGEVTIDDIRSMRERIRRELSKDDTASGTHDIKLGDGGLEELEFSIQYLQLRNCASLPRVAVPNTMDALMRLGAAGIISDRDCRNLRDIYHFYRTIETTLRLRNETVLKEDSNTVRSLAILIKIDEEMLMSQLRHDRKTVKAFFDSLGD